MYTSFGIKTEYSLLDSMIKVDDLILFAKENNIKTLSICDNNLCGVMEFYKACKKNNIKPIIGLDMKKFRLFAKNYDGYLNLIKINSLKNENLLDINNLKEFSNNIICILTFDNKEMYKDFTFFNDLYIGFKNGVEYSEVKDKGIYIDDVLFLKKEDFNYYKYLLAIKQDKLIFDIKDNLKDKYYHLEKELNYDLTNNYKISNLCNIEMSFNKSLIPKYDCPNGYNSFEYLKYLCKEGLKKIFGSTVGSKYIERLKYELNIINELNFCDYFLIVYDYVKFAKENNILVGPGRGSSAGSLVSYCLGIIEIDPLKYDLLFERFLNKERATMPDIDIDFDRERRDEVIDYCIKKYGEKRVASIITFSSLTSKQVLRDVGKVMNIDEELVDYFTRMFKPKMSLMENYNINDRIKNHINKNPEIKKIFDVSLRLENVKRHISQHASGIVISNTDIDNVVPLEKNNEMYITGYTANYLEELGLIKMDFLALKTLTIIDSMLSLTNIDYKNIPYNDSKTIDIFKNGNTAGIFQFESSGMISFLRKIKPRNFEEIYNIIALYRPGPMNNIDTFIKRRNGLEKIDYYTDSLKPVLKSTYGIIVYQEQIMRIANIMADYTLGEADILRKAMSKKNEKLLLSEKDKFISRAVNKGYEINLVNNVYNAILKFAEYGFAKSHAVAYSVISYKMAYIKANYPIYFYEVMLNNSIGSVDAIDFYIKECRTNNIKIINPNINTSDFNFYVKDDTLVYPFLTIKNINFNAASHIITERKKKKFQDIFDFVKRVNLKIINKDIFTNLILAGAFDEFKNRKTLFNNIDIIYNYAELLEDLSEDEVLKPTIIDYEEYLPKEITNNEFKVFGYYLNNHPVNEYRKKLNSKITISNISSYLNRYVKLIAKIDTINEHRTKKQTIMCFLKLSDEFASVDGTIFPEGYKEMPKFKVGDIINLYGKVVRKDGRDRIYVNKIDIL